MDSFFFNITDKCYKISELFKHNDQHIKRVDISNGLVFYDISLKQKGERLLCLDNLDRMHFIVSVKHGSAIIKDDITNSSIALAANQTYLFISSRQALDIFTESDEHSEVFILFIADFFLKRYLTEQTNEPINHLYSKMQQEVSLELIQNKPTDALSLHLIEKIVDAQYSDIMNSIIAEHRAIEYMIHRFSLIELALPDNYNQQEVDIAQQAKAVLADNFVNPPTIKALATQIGTNDFKLKKCFKKVFQTTIYAYVQKLRLEQANLLLREKLISVTDVANQVGYKHQGHFSALFFKAYGVYPKDLKNS